MATLLYITANPKAVGQSFCLTVGEAFMDAYREANPRDEIVELDLYRIDVPHIDTDVFNGWGKLQQGRQYDELDAEEKRKVARINELTEQFVAADKYVFVTPMWNLGFPPIVKAYIDNICIAGKTFRYTAEGPVGLMAGKRAVHIQSRGGVYSEGPAAELEFGDRYLRAILAFIGITEVESVIAEGMAAAPDRADSIKREAIRRAQAAAKRFAAETATV